MRPVSEIIRDRQRVIRRELDRRKVSLKGIAFDSGINYDTLISYFPGGERHPAEMPVSAAFSLCGVLPDDLLNLLCPDGFAVVRKPEGVDYDDIAECARDLCAAKDKAHHPASEAGREIGPTESAQLECKVVQLRGRVA
jgi:hypothetical protein